MSGYGLKGKPFRTVTQTVHTVIHEPSLTIDRNTIAIFPVHLSRRGTADRQWRLSIQVRFSLPLIN